MMSFRGKEKRSRERTEGEGGDFRFKSARKEEASCRGKKKLAGWGSQEARKSMGKNWKEFPKKGRGRGEPSSN